MVVELPASRPLTIPLSEPIVAVPGALLVQVPPGTISESVTGIPTHAIDGPRIGPGTGLTVTVSLTAHPVAGSV